jgi:hypothetical protein
MGHSEELLIHYSSFDPIHTKLMNLLRLSFRSPMLAVFMAKRQAKNLAMSSDKLEMMKPQKIIRIYTKFRGKLIP